MIGLKNQKCFFSADFHLNPGAESFVLERYLNLCDSGDHCFFLGDFFEVWYENKKSIPQGYANILKLLRKTTSKGVKVHLLKGNRDFLAGQKLIDMTGMLLHDKPVVLESEESKTLLIHGDELLSEDKSYQRFKKVIRSKMVVGGSRLLPQKVLKSISGELRSVSKKKTQKLKDDSYQPDFKLISKLVEKEKINTIIAGHLHKKMLLSQSFPHGNVDLHVLEQSGEKKIAYKILSKGILSEDQRLL